MKKGRREEGGREERRKGGREGGGREEGKEGGRIRIRTTSVIHSSDAAS